MKKEIFTKPIIGILLAGILSFACAKTSGNDTAVAENAPTPKTLTITIELKKDAKIKATIKQEPELNYSADLDSEDQLPEFYAKFKDQLEKSEDSLISIISDIPVTLEKNANWLAQARKSGAKNYYLKSEGKISIWKLDEPVPEIPQNNSEKPDPFALVVKLSTDGKIALNLEDLGTIEDLAPLENKLKDVFFYRKQSEAKLREEIDKPLTAVFLLIPKETSAFDENLSRIIKSLKDSGAEPIRIQLN